MKNSNQLTRFIVMVVIFSAILLLGFIGKAFSQITINNLTVTEGKGAMTSGFDVVVSFSSPNGLIYGAQANNERSNLRFGKTFGNKKVGEFSALATGGAFKNVPWIGPMFLYQYKWIDLFSWTGIGMATNKNFTDPGWKPTYFFNYEEAGLTLGKNRFAYSFILFTTEKINHFAIYRRTFPLNEKSKFFFETTWHFSKKIPMFVIGYRHSFSK